MTNLLKETLICLEEHDKTAEDVLWVGSPDDGYMSWAEYAVVADTEYDNDYGSQWIASNLVVVGNAWWLERGEYDGSEWWEYKELPIKPVRHVQVTGVDYGMWSTLKTISQSDI